MIIEHQIRDEKLQYDIVGKVDKSEYLTVENNRTS